MYIVSKTETFAKLFFLISLSGFFMYIGLAIYTFHKSYSTMYLSGRLSNYRGTETDFQQDYDIRLKYVLILRNLTLYTNHPFEEGKEAFNHCSESNCYVTYNSSLLSGSITAFDAIVFNLTTRPWSMLPGRRSPKQRYVFYGMSPSDRNVVCNIRAENLFNWTWTYKMSSEIFNPFFEVRDISGKVVAPKSNVFWKRNVPPTNAYVKNIIEGKRPGKALAWFVKNCQASNNRMHYAKQLKKALNRLFLDFDIYGCGLKDCPNNTDSGCYDIIKRDYFFYLAYEEGFAADYVTDEIITAVENFAVPIVVGEANYKNFLPDGSYIKAYPLNSVKLAALIDHVLKTPTIYNMFHRWRSYYSFKKVDRLAGICHLCTLLHDKRKVSENQVYKNFRKWWHEGALKDKCIPKGAESENILYSYLNGSLVRRG